MSETERAMPLPPRREFIVQGDEIVAWDMSFTTITVTEGGAERKQLTVTRDGIVLLSAVLSEDAARELAQRLCPRLRTWLP